MSLINCALCMYYTMGGCHRKRALQGHNPWMEPVNVGAGIQTQIFRTVVLNLPDIATL